MTIFFSQVVEKNNALQGVLKLMLSGVADQAALRYQEPGPDHGFPWTLPGGTRILLKHRPVPPAHGIDLQLSDHTHGGKSETAGKGLDATLNLT